MPTQPETVKAAYASPLGPMLMAATDLGLCGLWFEGQQHWPPAAARWQAQADHPVLAATRQALDNYFAGPCQSFELPLDLSGGSGFQIRVWRALLNIPAGQTLTYSALAWAIGSPQAARAVGAAVGRNPVSVVVPCHRVLGAGGALTGYAGGLARKLALLRHEGGLAPAHPARPPHLLA